jgi:hypothetical protein
MGESGAELPRLNSHKFYYSVLHLLFEFLVYSLFPTLCFSSGIEGGESTQEKATRQTTTIMAESADVLESRNIPLSKIDKKPVLKDFLKGKIPSYLKKITNFYQYTPGDGTPVSLKTTAAVTYDDENFYVGFICEDDPRKVRGWLSKRGDIAGDDTVIVYLDTFNDGQSAIYFIANPLGVQKDGLSTNEVDEDNRFDTVWYTDGRITEFGYVVLFTIPFKSLRFPEQEKQTWGIALGRSIVRNNESSYWPYITRRESSFLQQLGTMEISNVSPGRNIQLIPYATFTRARLLDEDGPAYDTDSEFRGGGDAKFVINNANTLDLTYNPDFSQVESDDPQVTVNKRFEVFYIEKRPFFLENIKYFETPLELLYTRRIIDPEFGGRFTGKTQRWNYGAFLIDDRAQGELVEEDSPIVDERTFNGVARVSRKFGHGSNIGILATGSMIEEEVNKVFSADARFVLTKNWTLTGQMAYSDDDSYDDDILESRTGTAYLADLTYAGRNLTYSLDYHDISPDFKARLGFIKRTDIRKASQVISYFWYPQNSRITSFGPSWTIGANWDHNGKLQDRYSQIDFEMEFAGPVGITLSRYDAFEKYLLEEFNYGTTEFSFYYNTFKSFTFNGGVYFGTGINYSTPEDVEPFKGDILQWSLGFNWRPAKRISLKSDYVYYRFKAPDYLNGQDLTDQDVFTNQFNRTKLNIQFTKELSLRFIADYYFLLPNERLIDEIRIEQLEFDILLTYLVNPFTALYVGYNTGYENFDEDPTGRGLLRSSSPDYNTQQQFFVKLTYLFQF